LEKIVAEIWSEVLGVERVGVHDNFFDLGGRSLLVVQVHGKLQRLLEREFPLVDLFKYTTVHTVAEYLNAGETGESSVEQGTGRAETRKAMRRRRNLR
jgi:acyl carrier protein